MSSLVVLKHLKIILQNRNKITCLSEGKALNVPTALNTKLCQNKGKPTVMFGCYFKEVSFKLEKLNFLNDFK